MLKWVDCGEYSWRLENDEAKKLFTCFVKVPLPSNVNKKNLVVEIKADYLKVLFKTVPPKTIIDGKLAKQVNVKDSTWIIDSDKDQRYLVIELSKRDKSEHWPILLESDKVRVEAPLSDSDPSDPSSMLKVKLTPLVSFGFFP